MVSAVFAVASQLLSLGYPAACVCVRVCVSMCVIIHVPFVPCRVPPVYPTVRTICLTHLSARAPSVSLPRLAAAL